MAEQLLLLLLKGGGGEAWIEREKPEKLLETEQDTDSTENAGKTLPKSKWVALCS